MSDPVDVVSGAELLVEALQREGADTIFTVPGAPIQEICRAAYQRGMRVDLAAMNRRRPSPPRPIPTWAIASASRWSSTASGRPMA